MDSPISPAHYSQAMATMRRLLPIAIDDVLEVQGGLAEAIADTLTAIDSGEEVLALFATLMQTIALLSLGDTDELPAVLRARIDAIKRARGG